MNIIEMAFGMTTAVERLVTRIRRFYYAVVLSRHECPQCGGRLYMTGESRCRCMECGGVLDPTIVFQRCSDCGGRPRLRVRRYVCNQCGRDIRSHFLFEGLVFDAAYFREKMAESRLRRREQRERVRLMLAETRSNPITLPETDWNTAGNLMQAIDGMTAEAIAGFSYSLRAGFDLQRYQGHIQAHIQPIATSLEQIPPLGEDRRIDRVWRFIAIVFLAHAGILDVWQEGESVMVIKHEAH